MQQNTGQEIKIKQKQKSQVLSLKNAKKNPYQTNCRLNNGKKKTTRVSAEKDFYTTAAKLVLSSIHSSGSSSFYSLTVLNVEPTKFSVFQSFSGGGAAGGDMMLLMMTLKRAFRCQAQ